VSQPPREMAEIWRPLLPTKRYSISGRSLGTSADILEAVKVDGEVRFSRFVVSVNLTRSSLLLFGTPESLSEHARVDEAHAFVVPPCSPRCKMPRQCPTTDGRAGQLADSRITSSWRLDVACSSSSNLCSTCAEDKGRSNSARVMELKIA